MSAGSVGHRILSGHGLMVNKPTALSMTFQRGEIIEKIIKIFINQVLA
jgi:hypothetical protein